MPVLLNAQPNVPGGWGWQYSAGDSALHESTSANAAITMKGGVFTAEAYRGAALMTREMKASRGGCYGIGKQAAQAQCWLRMS